MAGETIQQLETENQEVEREIESIIEDNQSNEIDKCVSCVRHFCTGCNQ